MDSITPRKGHRLWILWIIAILSVISITFVQVQPEMERNFRAWATSALLGLTFVLTAVWFLFLGRFSWQVRTGFTLLFVAGFYAAGKLVRKEGSASGTGLPKLVWAWTPKPDGRVEGNTVIPLTAAPADTNAAVIPDVPQFFGPNRDGVVHGANLATDWQTHPPRQLWRQPIGLGWSSFAVAGGRAYTQEQRGEDELVTCYDVLTGKLFWAHTNHVRFSQWQGGDGPRATPCVADGNIFAIGATGILDCLNATNGAAVWSHDILRENRLSNITWGISGSPLALGDKVIVTGGGDNGPTLLAFDRATGRELWRAGNDKASYASPTAGVIAGKQVILSVNAASLTVHDPATGAILLDWAFATDKWPKASQPVVLDGDRVFLSAGYGVGCVMLRIKAGKDGTGAEGKWTAAELWKNKAMKTQFNSVAFRGGFLYGMDDGLMACVDAATGARQWKDGRFGSGQSLMVDDLLLVQSEAGAVFLVSAKPDAYAEWGRLAALGSKTWNHPVLAGKYLLTRNDQEAVCYELPVGGANQPGMGR